MIEFTPLIILDDSDVRFEFSRSGGAGGQNVNKRNTQAVLYFSIPKSKKLTEEQKTILMCHACVATDTPELNKVWNRINSNGDIVIKSSSERSQEDNKRNAVRILNQELNTALAIPKERILKIPLKVKKKVRAVKEQHKTLQYKRKRSFGE